MQSFEHFVITRFNLPIRDSSTRWMGETRGLDPNWLSHRFELFEHFCLRSVASQTDKDFTWLVLFDSRTPEPFATRATSYRLSNYQPVFGSALQTYEEFLNTLNGQLTGRVSSDYLATTRLDNDDAIAVDFIGQIHRNIVLEDNVFLNPAYGYDLYRDRIS